MNMARLNRTNLLKVGLVAACMAALLALVAGSSAAAAGDTTRVSVNSAGEETTNTDNSPSSTTPSISADGRYVAFTSEASNLVADDTTATGTSSYATGRPIPPRGLASTAQRTRETVAASSLP
jgi:hypothetical protein